MNMTMTMVIEAVGDGTYHVTNDRGETCYLGDDLDHADRVYRRRTGLPMSDDTRTTAFETARRLRRRFR